MNKKIYQPSKPSGAQRKTQAPRGASPSQPAGEIINDYWLLIIDYWLSIIDYQFLIFDYYSMIIDYSASQPAGEIIIFVCVCNIWHLMLIAHVLFCKICYSRGMWTLTSESSFSLKGGWIYPRNLKVILLTKNQFSWESENTLFFK